MNHFYIKNHKIISFVFIICLLIPGISFSDNHGPEIENDVSTTLATPQTTSDITNTNEPVEKKKILTAKRELGPFFTIGLLINFAMMTTFTVWAIGQWRQNNDKKK